MMEYALFTAVDETIPLGFLWLPCGAAAQK
jgi:hypothetical protein